MFNAYMHPSICSHATTFVSICFVTSLGASSQRLLPDRGGRGVEARGLSFPRLGGSNLPLFYLERDLILYLSLGVKKSSLSGCQLGKCTSGEDVQQSGSGS